MQKVHVIWIMCVGRTFQQPGILTPDKPDIWRGKKKESISSFHMPSGNKACTNNNRQIVGNHQILISASGFRCNHISLTVLCLAWKWWMGPCTMWMSFNRMFRKATSLWCDWCLLVFLRLIQCGKTDWTGRQREGDKPHFTITTVILNEVDLLAIHQKDVLSQAFCSITKNILIKRMLRSFDSTKLGWL